MKRFGTRLAPLVLVVAMGTAGPSTADTIVINNGLAPPNPANVIDAGNSYPDDAVYVRNVRCSFPVAPCPLPWGDPTSVELIEGGSVRFELVALDSSSVSMSGGSVGNALRASDDATITLSGGSVGAFLEARNSSTVTLSGGSVEGELYASSVSIITLSGGSVGAFLEARNSSIVTLSDGSVGGYLAALDGSTVTLSGGSVGGQLTAHDSSTVTLSGGSVELGLFAYGFSSVSMRGGSVGTVLGAYDSCSVTIVGMDFKVDGVPVGFGPIVVTSGRLTGKLASGESIDNQFIRHATALITLVPSAPVRIDWVRIGDPGNAPDDATNCYAADCGSVADPYLISKHEVTNAQYAKFLNLKAAADPLGLYNTDMSSLPWGGITRSGSSGSYTYAVKPGFADKPVNYVSFYDALRFTNWLNNGQGSADNETGAYTLLGGTETPSNGFTVLRNPGANIFLPSENEWYKAAYYDGLSATYFDYPVGTNTATVCSAPTATANRANCNGAAGGLSDVGAYTSSASPYGTFDQGGNVWEWNEQILDCDYRGLRGGSFADSAGPLAASWFWVMCFFPPSVEGGIIGFRVASLVPEPDASPLALTSLACLVALSRRRVRNR